MLFSELSFGISKLTGNQRVNGTNYSSKLISTAATFPPDLFHLPSNFPPPLERWIWGFSFISLFGYLSSKPFSGCILDVLVIVFAASWATKPGFSYTFGKLAKTFFAWPCVLCWPPAGDGGLVTGWSGCLGDRFFALGTVPRVPPTWVPLTFGA